MRDIHQSEKGMEKTLYTHKRKEGDGRDGREGMKEELP